MLPNNSLASSNIPAEFRYKFHRESYLVDYEIGGVAIGDTTLGLELRTWKMEYNEAESQLLLKQYPEDELISVLETGITDVKTVTLSFDQVMRPTYAWLSKTNELRHVWFDSTLGNNTTTLYTDIDSVYLTMDDKRDISVAISDVIIIYAKNGNLYYRQQRDRYNVERLLSPVTMPGRIEKAGFSDGNRFQIKWSRR